MANTSQEERTVQASRFDLGGPSPAQTPPPDGNSWGARSVIVIVLVTILGGGAWGGVVLLKKRSENAGANMLSATVRREDMLVTVKEDGNIESAVNIDIKCEVAGGTSILWIVEDGKEVVEGEKLVELDGAALEEQVNGQKITFEKVRAAKIQAEKDYAAATLAVDEYLQGTFVQELQDKDAQITIALENLRSSQNALEHTQRMFRKGYVSALDLDSQKFSVELAQLELDSARTAKEVLEKFTKTKMVQELESKRDSAEAQSRSEGASFDLEESRLKRLEAQMENCLIKATASGMVVYANEMGGRMGGSQAPQIEEGAMVRERQTILRLPDLSKMQVKVNVHESKVEMLGRSWKRALDEGEDLRALIRIQDRELQGSLSSIANQPEPSGWWTGNIKEYATIVAIDGTPEGLRPGMTSECEILVEHLKDVLVIPVAAVVELRDGYFCWAKTDKGPERRPLVLGATNDKFVEVKDGVVENEEVVLNPRAMIPEARSVKEAAEDTDVEKKFGKNGKVPSGRGGATKGGGRGGPQGAAPAGASEKTPHGGGAAPGGAGRGGSGGGRGRSMNLMQFDKDGDGKISKDEAPGQMQQYFDRMDTDGDGFITKAEIDTMMKSMGGGAGKRPGG